MDISKCAENTTTSTRCHIIYIMPRFLGVSSLPARAPPPPPPTRPVVTGESQQKKEVTSETDPAGGGWIEEVLEGDDTSIPSKTTAAAAEEPSREAQGEMKRTREEASALDEDPAAHKRARVQPARFADAQWEAGRKAKKGGPEKAMKKTPGTLGASKSLSRTRMLRKGSSSEFVGVSWHKGSKKWQVRCGIKSKQMHVGSFTDEEVAAQAYIDFAQKHGVHKKQIRDKVQALPPRKRDGASSRFHGVSWCNTRGKWVVCHRMLGKKSTIGYFANEIEAARRYNEEVKKLGPDEHLNVIDDDDHDDADGGKDDDDDIAGASTRSAATPAANAAPEAAPVARPRQSVVAVDSRSGQPEAELKLAAMEAQIKALEAKAALEDAKAALAVARVARCFSSR